MKSPTIIFINLFVLLSVSNALPQGIGFEQGTFAEALAKAKKEGKAVFMDCYTSWCMPCKIMDKNVFPQKEVGDYFNEKFVSIKMDMEKGEGVELKEKYSIKAYPTLLFLSPEGKVMLKKVGAVKAEQLIEQGKLSLDPSQQISTLQKRYEDGDREVDFLIGYINTLKNENSKEKIASIVANFYTNTPKEALANEKALTILSYSKVIKYNDEAYRHIVTNKEKITATEKGGKVFKNVISAAVATHLFKKAKTAQNIDEINAEIQKTESDFVFPGPAKAKMLNNLASEHYLAKKDYDKWLATNFESCEQLVSNDKSMEASYALTFLLGKIEKNPELASSEMYKKVIKRTKAIIKKDSKKKDSKPFTSLIYRKLIAFYAKLGNEKGAQEALDKYVEALKTTGFWTSNSKKGISNLQKEVDTIGG